jgi:formylglycine-generating enzyme required for sulfatase activity/uncharacterized caspase-like protein
LRHLIRLALLGACAIALPAGPALAEKRLALAVGIDVYDHLPRHEQLEKAVSDARAMGAALRKAGFEAAVEENVGKLAFTRAWQKFLNRLEPGDTAAFAFADHGVEIGGLNYLLPRDVPRVVAGEDKVLAAHSIRFNELMDDLRERKVRVALFFVDACRDNPFRDSSGRSVGGTRGLARIEPAEGTFTLFSAGAGEQALDRLPGGADRDPNSVFTRKLLPILDLPGLSLQEIAIRVRRDVAETARSAGRKQTPAYYDQLLGEFLLRPGAPRPARPVPAPRPAGEAARAWAAAKDSASIAVLEAFRRQYGAADAFYDRLAAERIEALRRQQLAMLEAEEKRKRAEAGLARPGRAFRDCDVCPEMVVVPAGSFTMGSPPGEEGRSDSEGPQRWVTIARPLAVGKFEVTFDEWDACVSAGGCSHRPNDQGWGRGRRPAIDVSWNDITQQYLPWLSRKTGKTYRLLSEAEWEYVARAGTTTPFWWGSSISTGQANYNGNFTYGGGAKGEYRQRTVPVDSFAPNPWGLYNVHGNVREWVQDCWNDNYNGAPTDGSARTTGDCGRRVLRGGSWYIDPWLLRSASRYGYTPDYRFYDLGFRVGRTLTP